MKMSLFKCNENMLRWTDVLASFGVSMSTDRGIIDANILHADLVDLYVDIISDAEDSADLKLGVKYY